METCKISAKINVMDENICSKCRMLKIESCPAEIWGDGKVLVAENTYKCERLYECRYLRNLFGSANKTSPKIEEAESDP